MKKKILILSIVLALIMALAVPMAVLAADTTITGNIASSITITAPTGQTGLALTAAASDQSLVSDTGSIDSTVEYDITAVDAMDASKDSGDAGKMTQWGGASYTTGSVIAAAVKVGASGHAQGAAPAAISATPITIITNAPLGTGVNAEITVTVTTANEPRLTTDVYRIVITFTAVDST